MSDALGADATRWLTAKIVSSYLKKNHIAPADMPTLINSVHQSLQGLAKAAEPEPIRTPAVPIRRSVTPTYIVCLECGWRGKVLRRHLNARHGVTPDDYRRRWNLSPDHPITAPAYSARRSAVAKELGLGQGVHRRRGRRRATDTASA